MIIDRPLLIEQEARKTHICNRCGKMPKYSMQIHTPSFDATVFLCNVCLPLVNDQYKVAILEIK